MEKASFRRLLTRVGSDLSPEQYIELRDHLERIEDDRATDIALGARSRDVSSARRCPHCGANGAVKHGRDKLGRQRFKCRKKVFSGCGSTFNILTGTPRVTAHHERMKTFVNRLARGASTANLMTYLGWQRTVGRPGFGPESLLRDALGVR